MSLDVLGKMFLVLGGIIVAVGPVLVLIGRIPFLGRLPGDIRIQTDGFTCFFPVTTMVILSLIVTILINIILRFLSR